MKRRYAVIALALVVGLSTLSPALGGPSPAATIAGGVKDIAKRALGTSKKANKRSRIAKRQAERAAQLARQNAALIAELERVPGPPGPRGETGPQGERGQDATKLFGYIEWGATAEVGYGSGVEDVTRNGIGDYTVEFDRSLTSCVAQAVAGFGDPRVSGVQVEHATPMVRMDQGGPEEVRVTFRRPDGATNFGVATDTSFLITAFC